MTRNAILTRLSKVRSRGAGKWTASCPAHADSSPSLSVAEGDRGILVHCFAGCTTEDVVAALGLTMADLFFDARDSSAACRGRVRRIEERQRKAQRDEADGFTIDTLREADYLIRSRRGLDISQWSNQQLDDELAAIATAYRLLEHEGHYE